MKRSLFLRRRERPGGLAATLLSEHEPELAGRAEAVRMVRAERGARLVECECAQSVPAEEALLAGDLPCLRRSALPQFPRTPSDFPHRRAVQKRSGQRRASPIPAKRTDFGVTPQIPGIGAENLVACGKGTSHPRAFFARARLSVADAVFAKAVGMRVLVTGVSGYVGAAVAPALEREGHAVRGFARSRERVAAAGVALEDLVTGRRADRRRPGAGDGRRRRRPTT